MLGTFYCGWIQKQIKGSRLPTSAGRPRLTIKPRILQFFIKDGDGYTLEDRQTWKFNEFRKDGGITPHIAIWLYGHIENRKQVQTYHHSQTGVYLCGSD